MILAIETATDVCSVALSSRNGSIKERRTEESGRHSEKLFLFIESLQDEAKFEISDLSAVLISEGPGSYTGLRIGASGVKGLLYHRDIPLYAVNTLASLSWGIKDDIQVPTTVHSTINARRDHLYHQTFRLRDKHIEPQNSVDIRKLSKLNELIKSGHNVIGTGWERLDSEVLNSTNTFGKEKISARNLIALYDLLRLNQAEDDSHRDIVRRVQPADFDPRYVSSKKPGT